MPITRENNDKTTSAIFGTGDIAFKGGTVPDDEQKTKAKVLLFMNTEPGGIGEDVEGRVMPVPLKGPGLVEPNDPRIDLEIRFTSRDSLAQFVDAASNLLYDWDVELGKGPGAEPGEWDEGPIISYKNEGLV